MKGKITEVFDSVQGEGLYLGENQIFVRFFGCNLHCKFCDTNPGSFWEYDPQELIQELKQYEDEYHSISFTGGEPLLQKDFLKEVLKLTRKEGFRNYLETNGTLPNELEEVIDYLDIVAMDMKLPSSTGDFPFWSTHRRFLKIASLKEVFVKIVICKSTHMEDIDWALDLIRWVNPAITVVLQPDSRERSLVLESKIDYYKRICENRSLCGCAISQVHKVAGWE